MILNFTLLRGLTTRALDDYNRALELKPDHVLALLARADISLKRKDLIAARADLDSVDRMSAKQADVARTEEGQADLSEALLQEPRIADEFALRGIAP